MLLVDLFISFIFLFSRKKAGPLIRERLNFDMNILTLTHSKFVYKQLVLTFNHVCILITYVGFLVWLVLGHLNGAYDMLKYQKCVYDMLEDQCACDMLEHQKCACNTLEHQKQACDMLEHQKCACYMLERQCACDMLEDSIYMVIYS